MNAHPRCCLRQRLATPLWLWLWLISLSAGSAQPGAPLWTNLYGSCVARALAVDGSGNVFVTGTTVTESGALDGCATIKYSGSGVALWTNRCGGSSSFELSTPVAVDGGGNVFVTGDNYATIKYSGTGVALWTNRFNFHGAYAIAIAVDGNGNLIVTGGPGGPDFGSATIKYSGAGSPLWTNRYTGPEGNFRSTALAVDSVGDVVVTGYSVRANSGDFETLKYSGAGAPLWTNRYDGEARLNDVPSAVAVDRSGNVFVTGHSVGSDFSDDFATIKYSGAGVPLWTNFYNGPGRRNDDAVAVAVDESGNAFVTGVSEPGFSDPGDNGWDYATIKYSGAGVPLWTNRYHGLTLSYDEPTAIAVDGNGNAVVTGYSSDGSGTLGCDYVTIAYSGAGTPLWTNHYNGAMSGPGNPCLALSRDGSVYVAGTWANSERTTFGYATIKYAGAPPLSIPLAYRVVGHDLVLSWTNAAFSLQSGPLITGSFTDITSATSPFTNPISGVQKYFRLKAN